MITSQFPLASVPASQLVVSTEPGVAPVNVITGIAPNAGSNVFPFPSESIPDPSSVSMCTVIVCSWLTSLAANSGLRVMNAST